jgi:hypothetical protein
MIAALQVQQREAAHMPFINLQKLSRMALFPAALLAQACVGSIESPDNEEAAQGVVSGAPSAAQDPSNPPEGASFVGDQSAVEPPPEVDTGAAAAIALHCEDIRDEDVLAAVYGGPKVPPGFYTDAPEEDAWATWGTGCVDDLNGLTKDAEIEAESSAGWLTGDARTTPYYHEMDIALAGGAYTIHYRKTRCDYFNGAKLGGEPSTDALGELAMYLWYSNWSITGGYNALAGIPVSAGGAHAFTLCETRTTFGDCGLCDDIAVFRSTYTLSSDGTVTLPEKPELVRLIKGHCSD